jgi:hypothetical protein
MRNRFLKNSMGVMAMAVLGMGAIASLFNPAPASAGILDAILQPNYGGSYYGSNYRAPYYNPYGSRVAYLPPVAMRYGRPCHVSYGAPRGRAVGYYNNHPRYQSWGHSNRSHHRHDDD